MMLRSPVNAVASQREGAGTKRVVADAQQRYRCANGQTSLLRSHANNGLDILPDPTSKGIHRQSYRYYHCPKSPRVLKIR